MKKVLRISARKDGLRKQATELIPDGNLSACLTCGTCSSGCPVTGLHDMDPRKFIRMGVWGMDEELERHPWIWDCTMCNKCYDACPMAINIPALIEYLRSQWPVEERPKSA